MEKKDILCPDCEINYISKKQYEKHKKCMSCYRREILAIHNDYEYTPLKNLPDEEKARVAREREIRKNSYNNRKDKDKGNNIMENNSEIIHNRKAGRQQIYTPEIIEEIKTIANENITPTQLLGILKGLHPELNLTSSNLNNIINRHNIPHSSTRGRQAKNKIENINEVKSISNTKNDTEGVNIVEPEELYIENDSELDISKVEVPNDNKEVEPNKNLDIDTKSNKEFKSEEEPERFKPIKTEIDNLLEIKFKRMNCSVEKNYSVDDYINMLEMLIYLKENKDTIIKNRHSQQNIMNAYQSDTLHEIENAVLEDGNTYLSDKLHILRKYRRYYENDYKNVSALKPLLELVDNDTMQKALGSLKRNKSYNNNPVFKPLVDTTIINKYDWAKSMDLSSAKSNISIINYNPMEFSQSNNGRPLTRIGLPENTPPTSQLNSKMRRSLKVFRVSCKVSGGGYGVFKEWYRDYECTNSKTALAYATNTLNQLSSTRKGMYWTDLDVVELNVSQNKA